MRDLLTWNIYEITTKESTIKGVMLRGRIRKFALENDFNLLTENASDKENCVRFALLDEAQSEKVIAFIKILISDADIVLIEEQVKNPVLSKMKNNKEERYTI
jgi:hypothetical protein